MRLSSLIRDQTSRLRSRSEESTTGPPGKSHSVPSLGSLISVMDGKDLLKVSFYKASFMIKLQAKHTLIHYFITLNPSRLWRFKFLKRHSR